MKGEGETERMFITIPALLYSIRRGGHVFSKARFIPAPAARVLRCCVMYYLLSTRRCRSPCSFPLMILHTSVNSFAWLHSLPQHTRLKLCKCNFTLLAALKLPAAPKPFGSSHTGRRPAQSAALTRGRGKTYHCARAPNASKAQSPKQSVGPVAPKARRLHAALRLLRRRRGRRRRRRRAEAVEAQAQGRQRPGGLL